MPRGPLKCGMYVLTTTSLWYNHDKHLNASECLWRSGLNSMEHFHVQTANAIRSVRFQVRWKPGSAMRHRLKRRLRGHLPSEATLDDYEHIVLTVLQDSQAQVYRYRHDDTSYVAVVAMVEQCHATR